VKHLNGQIFSCIYKLSNVEPYFLEQEVQLPLVCILSLINMGRWAWLIIDP